MKRLTLNLINKELKKLGHESKLVKGKGYFYFIGGDAYSFESQGVYVYHLNALTLKEWIKEFEDKLSEYKKWKY